MRSELSMPLVVLRGRTFTPGSCPMAKRYSPLTVVVLVGAFALLGYMGARLAQKQASLQAAGASSAVHPTDNVHLTDKKKSVAPFERDGRMLAARTPADAGSLPACRA